jgi:type I restriction enzyme S subunit
MESNTVLYKPLGDLIELLTDYHANGAYEKLKENVTLLDKEDHAVMIRTTNFEANDFTNNLIYIDEHAYEFLKKSKVYASDLIMNKIANPGTVYFMPEISKPVSLGMNLFLIRINPKKANPYFLYAYLRKNEYYVKSFASGSTTKTITKDDVRRLKIYTPPLVEQNKIAQILSTWDQAISVTEKMLKNSQQQKKALMQQLLTAKNRLFDDNGRKFSDQWYQIKLSDFFERVTLKNNGKSTNVVTISAQHGLVKQEDFFKKTVASEILDDYFLLQKGQFAYNKSYSNGYPMGAIKRLNKYDNGVVTTLYICFEITNHNESHSDFWEHYFESGILNKGLSQIAHEGGRAHGLLNVKPSDFFNLKVNIPSYLEQKKIASVLTKADLEIETLRAQLDYLNKEKRALMQQFLTGKKRVKVAA